MFGNILKNIRFSKFFVLLIILLSFVVACVYMLPSFVYQKFSPFQCLNKPSLSSDSNISEKQEYVGGTCILVEDNVDSETVRNFLLPMVRNRMRFHTCWEQSHMGMVRVDMEHMGTYNFSRHKELQFHIAKPSNSKNNDIEEREHILNCRIFEVDQYRAVYSCDYIRILKGLQYGMYLLSLSIPLNATNEEILQIHSMHLTVRNPTLCLVFIMLALRTLLFPLVLAISIWLWRKLRTISLLMLLAGALCIINIPLEYTLVDKNGFRLLFAVRQWSFHAILIHSWLVLVGGHSSSRHLCSVVAGCLALFAFDICELVFPMYYPCGWFVKHYTLLALSHVILAAILASIYFIALCCTAWKAVKNLSDNDSRRRLIFLTLLCAVITLVDFVFGQVVENLWKWDSEIELQRSPLQIISVYVMWNFYIVALLI